MTLFANKSVAGGMRDSAKDADKVMQDGGVMQGPGRETSSEAPQGTQEEMAM